jgi:hypothetical protein
MMIWKAMPATVRLSDIVDALEAQFDESRSFLDLDSGEVETVSLDLLSEAEDGEEDLDLPECQEPEWELAKRIASSNRFVRLPTKYDVHEWQIMDDFSRSVQSAKVRDELLDAIHGAGAFRNFKSTLRRRRMEQDWFAFREDALQQIARDWCQEQHVTWEETGRRVREYSGSDPGL